MYFMLWHCSCSYCYKSQAKGAGQRAQALTRLLLPQPLGPVTSRLDPALTATLRRLASSSPEGVRASTWRSPWCHRHD